LLNNTAIMEKIELLKKERNAIILAHNYQIGEVQDTADYVGDSFELSRIAADSSADLIVFCGVHFMAESAAILSPEKIVLLPDLNAGCPLADMIDADQLRELKKQYPGAAVASYINSTAAVKAESDICITSANAVKVVNSLAEDTVLFVPDGNLAQFVAARTDKNIIPWAGYCSTHHQVTAEEVKQARVLHPDAVIIVHPECRPEVVALADAALGTGGMISYARETAATKIIIGTEMGMLHRLKKECPTKNFILLSPKLICPNMKYTTLEKVLTSLEKKEHVITVPTEIRNRAVLALERMLAVK
jgi:quinolinate synthase